MTVASFGSVCSGIEAVSQAWHPLGFRAAWFAEIDEFPAAVLAQHHPQVPNYGDMCLLPELIRSGQIEAPDILVGGTPCQAFSVAGRRNGMADPRGALSLAYIDILDAIDERRPGREAVALWENVPGVLSDINNAFGHFLAAIVGDEEPIEPDNKPVQGRSNRFWRWAAKEKLHVPKWPQSGCISGPKRAATWRVLDAQYFGVPQRRRRVFVVASARRGADTAGVLFERESLRGGTAQGGITWPETAAGIGAGATIYCAATGQRGGAETGVNVGATLSCNHEAPIIANTLLSGGHSGNPADEPLVIASVKSNAPISRGIAGTLMCSDDIPYTVGPGGGVRVHTAPTVDRNSKNGPVQNRLDTFCVSFQERGRGENKTSLDILPGLAYCLTSPHGGGRAQERNILPPLSRPRRLTPTEYERLQGFKAGHTAVLFRGKPVADSHRYKAVGNSMAVPVIAWIGKRLLTYASF